MDDAWAEMCLMYQFLGHSEQRIMLKLMQWPNAAS